MSRELITANHAAALAAARCGEANRSARGFGGGVYPITPQTECIELLCDQTITKSHVVRVESEHSALAVCMGFAIGGARSFTASSSNGLAYMAENVFAAGLLRLPIVMMAVNRTLGPPWNIWVDHGDTLMLRDAGWIQLYCEDNQDVFDSILLAYRLAEDPRILLPVMVCQDAFVLSHTMMMTEIAEQAQVDAFLPPLDLESRLRDHPRVVGGLEFPHETEMHRGQMMAAMARVPEVYRECQEQFAAIFGRRPADAVVPYRTRDAEIVLVSMGTTASTARTAVDVLRSRGVRAGALRVRTFRPFPRAELSAALAGLSRVAVVDRDLCPGLGGVLWAELGACVDPGSIVQGYLLGLGGGDVQPRHLEQIVTDLLARQGAREPVLVEAG